MQLPLSALFPHYTHLLLAHGASQSVPLKGLDPKHTLPALSLVHWYTGHPSHPLPPPLSSTKHLTLIGHGNVSLDIARLLLSDPSSLHSLDIPSPVIAHLGTSSIKHITITSRRGPAEAAFTAKELRELLNLPTAYMEPIPAELLVVPEGATRQQKRILDLLRKGSKAAPGSVNKSWSLQFFRSPRGSVPGSITYDVNVLDDQRRAQPSGQQDTQSTDLVITSVGYRSEPLQATPDEWYETLGRVRSFDGKVHDSEGRLVKNVYASGWAANGAKGVLASSMYDAYSVSDMLVQEHLAGPVEASASPVFQTTVEPMAAPKDLVLDGAAAEEGTPHFLQEVATKVGRRVIGYEDWKKINEEEVRRGQLIGKEKERMLEWEEVDSFLAT